MIATKTRAKKNVFAQYNAIAINCIFVVAVMNGLNAGHIVQSTKCRVRGLVCLYVRGAGGGEDERPTAK